MTLDQGIAAVIAGLVAAGGTLLVQILSAKQKKDELLLIALQHLSGGSQERNVGLSAIELSLGKNEKRNKLCISLLVGSAIYLLSESKQEDSTHEIYNLRRIVNFLSEQRQIINNDEFLKKSFEHLIEEIRNSEKTVDEKMKSKKLKEAGEKYTKYKGLWVEKKQLEVWYQQLGV